MTLSEVYPSLGRNRPNEWPGIRAPPRGVTREGNEYSSIKEELCSKRGPVATDQRPLRARREVARRRAPRRSRSVLNASSGSCSSSCTSRGHDEEGSTSKKKNNNINTRKGVQFHLNGNPRRSQSFCYASQGLPPRHRSNLGTPYRYDYPNLSSSMSWASSTDAVLSAPLSLGSTLDDEKVEDDKDIAKFVPRHKKGNTKAQRSHSFCYAPRGLHNNDDGGDGKTANKGVKFLSNGAISFTGPIALYCVPPTASLRESSPKRRRSRSSFSSSLTSGSKLDDVSEDRKTNSDAPKSVQFHFNPKARRSHSFCHASQGSRNLSWPYVHDDEEDNNAMKCVQFHYPTALFSVPFAESVQDTSSTFSTACNPRSDSGTRMRRTSSGGGGGSSSKPSSSGLDCNPFSGSLWDKREGL